MGALFTLAGGVILLIFLRDFLWLFAVLFAMSFLISWAINKKRRREAEEYEMQQAAQQTKKPTVIPNRSNTGIAPPRKTKTDPTAQNAYIYNIDYIKLCRTSFIAFDVETTGLSPSSDRIVEIAAVKYNNAVPGESFSTLINPERHIPSSASSVNHIYDSDVTNAPTEQQAIRQFCEFI